MTEILWIVGGLISGTILFEAYLANRRLNEQIAALELWVRDDDDVEENDLP